jgi:hypothetical protein
VGLDRSGYGDKYLISSDRSPFIDYLKHIAALSHPGRVTAPAHAANALHTTNNMTMRIIMAQSFLCHPCSSSHGQSFHGLCISSHVIEPFHVLLRTVAD